MVLDIERRAISQRIAIAPTWKLPRSPPWKRRHYGHPPPPTCVGVRPPPASRWRRALRECPDAWEAASPTASQDTQDAKSPITGALQTRFPDLFPQRLRCIG